MKKWESSNANFMDQPVQQEDLNGSRNLLEYTLDYNLKQGNLGINYVLEESGGLSHNLVKTYIVVREFDTFFDNYNTDNLDPDDFLLNRAFKEPIHTLIRHFE